MTGAVADEALLEYVARILFCAFTAFFSQTAMDFFGLVCGAHAVVSFVAE
jgi:hypothetical protein